MKFLLSFLLLISYTAVLSRAQASSETTLLSTDPTETSTEITSETPTTLSSTTITSTEDPTTTLSSTTTSTETTPITKAVVTTSSPPLTTAAPKSVCEWNTTCIRVDMNAHFTIPVEGKNYSSIKVHLGCDAKATSDCSANGTQTLYLVEANQYNLTLIFRKESSKVFVSNITYNYELPGEERVSVANNEKHFNVDAGKSYLCRSESSIKLENVTMEVSDVQIQAYGEKEGFGFGSVQECEADEKVNPLVPIAVGVFLAALIIIVLIAYLVGRRRSRQRGYQSV